MIKFKISHITALYITIASINVFAEAPKTAVELGIMQGSPPEHVIDMSKWDKGPDNRWSFQHISEIIPTANVSKGLGKSTELATAYKDVSNFTFKDSSDKTRTVKDALEETYTDSFMVLHEGKVVYEEYFNGMTKNTKHLLMSVSKSLTGSLAGSLVIDGRLNPDAKVIDYIPELKNSEGYADATVRQVLDMTTSIQFSEDYADPKAEVVAHEESTAWRGRSESANNGIYAFAQTVKHGKDDHGKVFQYASINTDVLGWLIERVSGQRFSEFMSESIWSKLGAEHDADLSVDYKGSAVANGGFVITTRDMARFGQMMLDNGKYNGQQIVSTEWVKDTLENGNNDAWKPTHYSKHWPNGFYRNQWYITKDDNGSYFAIGVNGQHIWINPTTKTVIAKFSSYPISADKDSMYLSIDAMDAISRELGKK